MIDKVYISYFYMIRFFTPNMVPLSTAIWDPKWYHEFKGQDHVFLDKRGVLNGLRVNPLHPTKDNDYCVECQRSGDPNSCEFIKIYRKQIFNIDMQMFVPRIEKSLNFVQRMYLKQETDLIPVFIVHEAPDNPCSERSVLFEWFEANNIQCKELEKTDI